MAEFQVGRRAQTARWVVRGLMIAAILFLALQRGSSGGELFMLGAIVAGALLLPMVLTWCWRSTGQWPRWQRISLAVSVAVGLLFGFSMLVKTLVD